ncbi:MAG: exo-beta-1,3-glucanase [Methylococcaceae bacterium]|nr:exo-beta-1,3-glucanase [Methylococcaceae bacterium]
MKLCAVSGFFLLLTFSVYGFSASSHKQKHNPKITSEIKAMQCVAFSPYVGNINPNFGPHPSSELIESLLDKLVKETRFRCIMTYGVMNGLEHTFAAAKARNMKVIAIIWLDKDKAVNDQSIAKGIENAKAYPETIVKLSCGSEVRTRHGNILDGEIVKCIDSLRNAGVKQPITTIDTWWEWCDRSAPCRKTGFEAKTDWIGINVFPWWENKHAAVHSCIPADKAADFHIAKIEELRQTYPGKDVVLTEFGWPNGPEGATEINKHTGEKCGVAGKKNQLNVIKSTLKKLAKKNWSANVFEAFSEKWKPADEGNFGSYWGICQGEPPYSCLKDFK